MKRIIFIMLASVKLYSLDHGLITGFEVGYNILSVRIAENDKGYIQSDLSNSLYVSLKTGYRIEGLRVVGTYINTMHPIEIDSYNPVQDLFDIDISYTIDNFTIGFNHMCDHPVNTIADQRSEEFNIGQRSIYIRYYQEF